MSDDRRSRTEVVPEVIFLGKLVERIAAGRIRVPRFQRTFVWKQADLHALLDSILRGFPIGSILVWETEENIESTDSIGPVQISPRPDGMIGYLLDGQQRVSTLVGTLRLTDEMNATVDQVDWRVYCNLDTRELHRAPAEGVGPKHFPVRSLLNTAGFFEACRRIQSTDDDADRKQRWLDEADRLANAFRDYQLPLIRIRDADLDSAVAVFARLNRTGRKMAADEMVSALTYQRGQFHLAQKLTEFEAELDKKRFGNLDRIFLLRAVLAALRRDIYAKDWALMVKPEVRGALPSAFESAREGIRHALDFLANLGVTSDRLLPYGLQLVFLGEFFRLCPQPTASVVKLLSRWFWVTSFAGWFGAVRMTQIRRALSEIRGLATGDETQFSVVSLEVPAQPFPDRFDGRSARVRAFLLYLASLEPRSLLGEGTLDPGELLSTLGTGALGYVSSNLPQCANLIRSPANRMYVDRDHVGQALGALEDLPDDVLTEVLPTHGFPVESIDHLRSGNRIGLIEARLEILIDGEREFMEARNVVPPQEQTAAIIADSDASDEEYSDFEPGEADTDSGETSIYQPEDARS